MWTNMVILEHKNFSKPHYIPVPLCAFVLMANQPQIFMFYSGDDDDDARPCVVIALDRSDPVPVPVSHIVLFMWKLNMCEG